MDILPDKSIKGIWIIAMIVMVMVLIIFMNQYVGPNRAPLFGFAKKATTSEA